jgi:aryl-alcohol dehydrogenase-like predicted oxidoreductase
MVPLTGTTSAAHMRDDLASLDLELGPDDMATLDRCAG